MISRYYSLMICFLSGEDSGSGSRSNAKFSQIDLYTCAAKTNVRDPAVIGTVFLIFRVHSDSRYNLLILQYKFYVATDSSSKFRNLEAPDLD
jgi:hypothetical protein